MIENTDKLKKMIYDFIISNNLDDEDMDTPLYRDVYHYMGSVRCASLLYEAAKALPPERWKDNTGDWTIPDEVHLNQEKGKICKKSRFPSNPLIKKPIESGILSMTPRM